MWISFIFISLIFLTSCAGGNPFSQLDSEARLAELVEEGYLAQLDMSRIETGFFREVVTAERRTLNIMDDNMVWREFLNIRHQIFELEEMETAIVHVSDGQWVQAGDLLLELMPTGEIERPQIRLRGAQQNLERFERDFAQERDERLNGLEDIREELQLAGEENWQLKYLTLARNEADFELFLLRGAQNREILTRQLDEIYEYLTETQIFAPIDGPVSMIQGSFTTEDWHAGIQQFRISITDEDSFFFFTTQRLPQMLTLGRETEELPAPASIRPGSIIPMLMRVIGGDDYTIYMQVVNDPWVTGERLTYTYTRAYMNRAYFLTPADRDAFNAIIDSYGGNIADMHLTLILRTEMPIVNTLTLQTNAIRTLGDRNYVYVYENGDRRRQYVAIGVAAGRYTQILSGLTEGQQVMVR